LLTNTCPEFDRAIGASRGKAHGWSLKISIDGIELKAVAYVAGSYASTSEKHPLVRADEILCGTITCPPADNACWRWNCR
jgi:hypothetical protein